MLSVKPWRLLTVLQFFAALLFCICLGAVISGILQKLKLDGFRQPDDFGNLLIGTLSFQGAACALILIFWRRHQIGWRAGFGFSGPQLRRALGLALLVFPGALLVVWLLQAACVCTLTALGHPPEDQTAVQLIESARSWWARAYFTVFAVVLAPVTEEFIFRGLLYPCAKQFGTSKMLASGIGFLVVLWATFSLHHIFSLNLFLALGISLLFAFGILYPLLKRFSVISLSTVFVSFLFALIHFDAAIFLPLLLLALVLTWLYERTDNLLAPITVHALFNASNLAMLVVKHLYVDPHAS